MNRKFSGPLRSRLSLCLGLAVYFLGTSLAAAPRVRSAAEGMQRFALVVGINDGGAERVSLRYAGRDARAFHEVMTRLGGVAADNAVLVSSGDAEAIRRGFQKQVRAVARAKAAGHHTEFLFFYSGHSDEEGLRMQESLLPYRELRDMVQTIGADVQVAVLDSCASGTLTRLKGGKRRAPFLLDLSSDVSGHAFLTSASDDESAQESDRIQASFFTHYLVTGLRGAADFNSDGRVTLNEAYRFAFDETLAKTQNTQAGVQHPAYDIQLVGTGDLVMTDLQGTTAGLALPKPIAGRFYIRNEEGFLVAELYKPAARAVQLALAPGQYTVAVQTEAQKLEGRVELKADQTHTLSNDTLTAIDEEQTTTRGSSPQSEEVKPASDHYREVPVAGAVFSPVDSNEAARHDGAKIINHAQFNLLWGRTDVLDGIQLGVANHVDERATGVQLALAANSTAGPMRGAQISSGVNLAYGFDEATGGEMLRGAQVAAGVNLLQGNLLGVQVAAGLNGVDGDARAAQVASGLNGLTGDLQGVQAAGGVNLVLGTLQGAQAAGGVNVAGGSAYGLQIAGGVNYAGELYGAQLAPLNVAYQGRPTQVGVVNVGAAAHATTQIGVFNYADEADAQVGVLSMTRKGGVHPQLWSSSTLPSELSLRFDANYTYSVLHVGPNYGAENTWNAGIGLGAKAPLAEETLWLEFDVSTYFLHYEKVAIADMPLLGQARMMMRYQWHAHWSVFGGATFNALWASTRRGGEQKRPGYGGVLATVGEGEDTARFWPGFALGLGF